MLVRLSVPAGLRLENATCLDVTAAGGEGNALAGLSALGRRCGLVTALPENPLGRLVSRQLRSVGVDVKAVAWKAHGRVATYYVESGRPPRATRVIYDRRGSCASELEAADVDWGYLTSTRLLVLSGITPALSDSCSEVVAEARRQAQAQAIPIAFDVNYRQALWPAERARACLSPLLREAEIVFCSARDARAVFGLSGSAGELARRLGERIDARAVVVSRGADGAVLWRSAAPPLELAAPRIETVDRLGSGDALAAGVIDGWLDGDLEAGLTRGITLASLARTQHGDMLITNRAELDELVGVPPCEDVQR